MTETNQISAANYDLHSGALARAEFEARRKQQIDAQAKTLVHRLARRLQRERLDKAMAILMQTSANTQNNE